MASQNPEDTYNTVPKEKAGPDGYLQYVLCVLISQKSSEVDYLTLCELKLQKVKLASRDGIWIITVVGYWWAPMLLVLLLVFSLRFGVIITLQPLHLCRGSAPSHTTAPQPLFSLATSGTCRHGCLCKVSTSVFNPQCTVFWFASYIRSYKKSDYVLTWSNLGWVLTFQENCGPGECSHL